MTINTLNDASRRVSRQNYTHHFLIAAPQMADARFEQTLIYICRHDEHGVLGLIINRPILDLSVGRLLEDLDIEVSDARVKYDLPLESGPLHPEVGFVLHTGQPQWRSSYPISENSCITTSKDILRHIAEGHGVGHYHLCLGHASWGKGQLQQEIQNGDWFLCPADLSLLFETPFEERWRLAGEKIGIHLDFLSDDIGHA